jgi:hypothetical protein
MKIEFSQQIFEEFSSMKFHEKSSSGNRVPNERTDRLTDMKLIVAFRNFSKASKNDYKKGIAVTNVLLLHHVITNCND